MLTILSNFGGASGIISADMDELDGFINKGHGRKAEITAEDLKISAIGSIGVSYMDSLVKDSAKKIIELQTRDDELTKALLSHENEIHKTEMEILCSIPGIGDTTAAHFLAEIEDISNFDTYQKLIAYAGTDPSISESGDSSINGHITKHGNRSLRKYGYIIAQKAIIFNPVMRDYYDKKVSQGFTYRKAVVAVMNKMFKLIFTLLTRGEKFQKK